MNKVFIVSNISAKLKDEYVIDIDDVAFINVKEVEGDGYSVDLTIAMKSYETVIKLRTSKEIYLGIFKALQIFQINR